MLYWHNSVYEMKPILSKSIETGLLFKLLSCAHISN